jgi:hypothetical protein
MLTWYSTMTSRRSSARSHTAIMTPSFSASPEALSVTSCSLFLIPSRALEQINASSSRRAENTHSYKPFRRLSSSTLFVASPSTVNRSNRARTESTLSMTGDVCVRVIRGYRSHIRCSYLVQFQEHTEGCLEPTGHRISLNVEAERRELTVNWVTWS